MAIGYVFALKYIYTGGRIVTWDPAFQFMDDKEGETKMKEHFYNKLDEIYNSMAIGGNINIVVLIVIVIRNDPFCWVFVLKSGHPCFEFDCGLYSYIIY